jgi:Ca2+:H+ antiporter
LIGQLKMIFVSWLNILLCFVPSGFALYYTHRSAVTVFIVNFMVIIPTSAILGLATEELAMCFGETMAGLLSMTFRCVRLLVSPS